MLGCSEEFPSSTAQLITAHTDEVWHCRFSPDGTKLATGSKDGSLIIYDINMVGLMGYCRPFLFAAAVQPLRLIKRNARPASQPLLQRLQFFTA